VYILGIHPGGHDTSASLLKNGKIIIAVEEERFSKVKHSTKFPELAINECLRYAKIKINEVDVITLSGDYKLHIQKRYLENWSKYFPKNKHRVISEFNDFQKISLINEYIRKKYNFNGIIYQCRHHLAHFASSYYISNFKKSALYSIDGVGDYESSLSGYVKNNNFKIFDECTVSYPHSIGLVYTAITAWLGFIPHCDEGKTMGLAPYGDYKKYYLEFKKIIKFEKFGKISINLDYFNYPFHRRSNVSNKFCSVFGSHRKKNQKLTKIHMNVAATLQFFCEKTLIHGLNYLYKKTKSSNLSLAGGVALNCVANGKIFKYTKFKNVSVQPAAGDAGTSLGSALYWYNCVRKKKINKFKKLSIEKNIYAGPEFSDYEILKEIKKNKLKYKISKNIYNEVSQLLKEQKIVGWFNGRMEFGPRALGNRSILTSPYPNKMKDILNLRVKKRESFRPFAPAILRERVYDYFEFTHDSPHMLFAMNVKLKKIKSIPAVTHIDKTARVQTVDKKNNEKFYNLINAFYKKTNIPVLLNTSLNIMGQPICYDPSDAIKTFLQNDIDYLILNAKYILKK
tara:strand:+ start:10366 stop:12069 length:1704 start_codon:yes stop_codon:yes gene_type:complete